MENYCKKYLQAFLEKDWTQEDVEMVKRLIVEKEILRSFSKTECEKNVYEYLFKGWFLSENVIEN